LKPKSRTHTKKKLSSAEGLEILRKWQTQRTILWFASLEMSDWIPNCDATVVSVVPDRVEIAGDGQIVSFDPVTVEFWLLDEEDIPLREVDLAPFVRFLGMRKLTGDKALSFLAERASLQ
jgi:hypothetical protein